MIARKFGRLTIIAAGQPRERRGRPVRTWVAQCDCGGAKTVVEEDLHAGSTRSCGCLKKQRLAEHIQRCTKHGFARKNKKRSEYRVWRKMIERCEDARNKDFADYGGRGIAVCRRWRDSFELFYADMGPRPSAQHSIDRFPNNDGNYEPGNCRWATLREQGRNKRNNRLIDVDGVTRTLAEWAERTGIGPSTLWYRLQAGLSPEVAISKPLRADRRRAG